MYVLFCFIIFLRGDRGHIRLSVVFGSFTMIQLLDMPSIAVELYP